MSVRVEILQKVLSNLPFPRRPGERLNVALHEDPEYLVNQPAQIKFECITVEAVPYQKNRDKWLEWEIIL